MKLTIHLTLTIILSLWQFTPVATTAAEPEEPPASAPEAAAKPEQADIFDFQGAGPVEQNNEDDLALDDRIRVKVEPVVRNPVIERVVESARIKVRTPPGFFRVDIFIEPVDAPFGGKSLAHPKMLGQAFGNGNFTLKWASPERYEYVKIFALAYKNPAAAIFSAAHGRSRAVDVALGGNRLLLMPDMGP